MSILKNEYHGAEPPLRITLKRKVRFLDRIAMNPLFDWLSAGREEVIELRKRARAQYGLLAVADIPCFEIANYWRLVRRKLYLKSEEPLPIRTFTRTEKLGVLGALALVGSCSALSGNGSASISTAAVAAVPKTTVAEAVIHPLNWLTGTAEKKGSKEAVLGAYSYAKSAGYTFAANKSDVEKLVSTGELVKLEGKYLKLIDVSEPYALPAVATFVNRLAKQYAAKGCGKLGVTSAVRTLEVQATLENGSKESVHPTGMSIDLRRAAPEDKQAAFCLSRLEKLLETVEKEKRIDVTVEKNPSHFHVVVVPHVYENWLKLLKPSLDPEVEALATALFFEGSFDESDAGYEAIAAVIKNRARSAEYPNTILEVVAEGAAGRSAGGCQFSFMCDGRAENIQTLCSPDSKSRKEFWESLCEGRWNKVVDIAKKVIASDSDPTGGATLYYAASMDKAPYWAKKDMKRGTVRTIGSHVFACSNNRGKDVCGGWL